MRFEILINDEPLGLGISPNSLLDTFQEESISLNYNIADITDISKKNSSYSKTIQLPDTRNNRIIFTNIFNIENTSESVNNFDTNRKVKCWVLADSIIIFKGNLQLTNIVYDFENNRHLYEVIIYSDNDTLFKSVGEKLLSDLDLSSYDHTYTRENIEKSWGLNGGTGEYTDGYFYPLIDYGFPFLYPTGTITPTNATIAFNKLYTAVYAKIIFDRIFSEAGFSYTSNFLNNYRFTDLIIPFSNKTFATDTGLISGFDNIILSINKSATSSIASGIAGGGYNWSYYNSLNIDTISYNPNNLYSTASFYYVNSTNTTSKQRFTINFRLRSTNYKPNTIWVDDIDDIRIWCKRSTKSDGTTNPAWSNTPTYNQLYNPSDPNYFRDVLINGGQGISVRNVIGPNGDLTLTQLPNAPGGFSNWLLEGTVTTDWLDNDPIQPNEQVRFFLTRFHGIPLTGPAEVTAFEILPNTLVYSTIDPTGIVYGGNIIISKMLPANTKQKDFLTSIFKMFNLYIEPSKELENHFIIEPRDEYYSRYLIAKDWSNKLDLTQPINSEILSNLQQKTNLFTYKADKDVYNTNYTTGTNEIFGQFEFELDNDFLSGENKIEPIFSPTPIDELKPTGSGFYLPIIANLNNGNAVKPDGMNIRILFRRLISTITGPFVVINPITNVLYSYTFYPYAGPDDDPLTPNYTLNFGSISPFISGYTQTLKNLFNTYYRNQISELNDRGSRLITANFNLDYNDINTFKFSDLIFTTIGGMSSWYRVVKIMDYDPIAKNSTKVQLIKAYNYKLPDPTGATPSVEFCSIKPEITFSYEGSIELVSTIGAYANSPWPYLTFWNTYENVGYSYGLVSEFIGIADIELWAASAGIPGFVFSYNTIDQLLTVAWKIDVPCETGPYSLVIGMSDTLNSINNINLIYDSTPVECVCDDLNRVSPYVQEGLRNAISTDNVLVGVLNTSTSNRTTYPNVAMVGTNNNVSTVGTMLIGDSNSSFGQNSLLVGKSNQITSEQSMVVGDTNIVNGKNSLILGSNNQISPPQSFVMGIGNELLSGRLGSSTFSVPGTTSIFGTFSEAGTQSILVFGNDNTSFNSSGFVYGNNNFMDDTLTNPFIFGSNNIIAASNSASFSTTIDNLVLFGNSNSIINTTTQSISNSYIFGSNITLTQSLPSNTFYIGSDTIEINTNTFITNVVGTSSFNKVTIGELVLERPDNYGTFRLNQYNPADYPGGSYLEITSPITGMEFLYQDYDNGYFYIQRTNLNTLDYQGILMNNTAVSILCASTVSQSNFNIKPDRFQFDYNIVPSKEDKSSFLVTSTSSTNVDIYIWTEGISSHINIEVTILGYNQGNNERYSAKKVALFRGFTNQIGTTQTIYEITDMPTYSTDISGDVNGIFVSVSGGATDTITWTIFVTSYY